MRLCKCKKANTKIFFAFSNAGITSRSAFTRTTGSTAGSGGASRGAVGAPPVLIGKATSTVYIQCVDAPASRGLITATCTFHIPKTG